MQTPASFWHKKFLQTGCASFRVSHQQCQSKDGKHQSHIYIITLIRMVIAGKHSARNKGILLRIQNCSIAMSSLFSINCSDFLR